MLSIENALMMISYDEDSRTLALVDKKRGTHWVLDPQSLAYGRMPDELKANDLSARQAIFPAEVSSTHPGTLSLVYQAGKTPVEITYALHDDYVEVHLPVPADDIGFATLPGSFLPEDEPHRFLLPIMQGMLWDGRGPEQNTLCSEGHHSGFTMPFVGLLAQRGGLLMTAESQDDCLWWYGKAASGQTWATNVQIASLGTMRYERTVRLYVTDPDIVAITKQYRRKVIEQGRFKSWDEKIAERPALERIFGALMCYIGYCEDDIDYVANCKKLKAYGFDRALLYPGRFNTYYDDIRMGGVPAVHLNEATVKAIKALGYDMAPWSWLNEALPASGEDVTKMYRRDRQGQIIPNWQIDDQQWNMMCYSYIPEYQQKALKTSITDMTWDHFDVLACIEPMECYALDHPQHLGRPSTRTEDRQWIRDTFMADQAAGLIVSSETFNDAYSLEYDFGSVKALPLYGPWPFWPVPLTMLVYHDSMVHSWWEPHNYNNPWHGHTSWGGGCYQSGGGKPHIMAAMDALMGCPPDVFPFGAMYTYIGHGSDTMLYKNRFEDAEVQVALKQARPVAQLHQRIGKQEMVDFEILSDDGYVQQTTFADGTRVTANFSLDFVNTEKYLSPQTSSADHVLSPESWRVD
ncbi:hypothetical protein G4Y79_07280 [Phototrophicus methaneseepsis]|uniref:Uncharacterized protein n=1 Tax=Phototrophicus methaneseepsis TaxID=2710758 RepID=A0A7S8IG06_9CHLR|nr:hypothetical protein [Phototrophicus methaneseepsis]QPC84166.1 hypothetical protein G4Y79_07280 [Phototrophicus methaneseepsis]